MKKSIVYGMSLLCTVIIVLVIFLPHHSKNKGEHPDSQIQYGNIQESANSQFDKKEVSKLNLFAEGDCLNITNPILYLTDEKQSLKTNLSLNDEGKELFSTQKYTPYYYIDVMIRNSKGDYFYQSEVMLWNLQETDEFSIDIQNLYLDRADMVIEQLSHDNNDNISLEVTVSSVEFEYIAVYNLDIDLVETSVK